MPIKTIIVEDEPHSQERIKSLLGEIKDIEVIGIASNGEEAVEKINETKPELVFLDINLPGLNGFEVLKKISHRPMVIFTTAYENYALKAFEENAIDYILKPISLPRLKDSVNKVLETRKTLDEHMVELIKKVISENSGKNYITRFSVKEEDDIIIIPKEDIFYFKAEDKYTFLCTTDKEFYYDSNLKNLEENLEPSEFLRIHKSYIVSLSKIKKVKKWFLSDYTVELSDKKNTSLKVGRNYLPLLKEKLKF